MQLYKYLPKISKQICKRTHDTGENFCVGQHHFIIHQKKTIFFSFLRK